MLKKIVEKITGMTRCSSCGKLVKKLNYKPPNNVKVRALCETCWIEEFGEVCFKAHNTIECKEEQTFKYKIVDEET